MKSFKYRLQALKVVGGAFFSLLIFLVGAHPTFSAEVEGNPGLTPEGVEASLQVLQIQRIPDECWVSHRPTLGLKDGGKASIPVGRGEALYPSVDCWLEHIPKVASEIYWEDSNGVKDWKNWSNERKKSLRDNFLVYWNFLDNHLQGNDPDPMVDPPNNLVPLGPNDDVVQILSPEDAWKMFIKHVALSLAVEMKGFVPWSVQGYSSESLQSLFDGRKMFDWHQAGAPGLPPIATGVSGYVMSIDKNGGAIPAPPMKELLFLSNGLIGKSKKDTIGKLITWGSQLTHMLSWPNGAHKTSVMTNYWQYPGWPPISRILDTTTYSGPPTDVDFPYPRHWTLGCFGTVGFLKALLRTVNIPVEPINLGHFQARFMTENLYITHGDDLYGLFAANPPIPHEKLLITKSLYDNWFGPNVSDQDKYVNNIGRQVYELHIEYLPNVLLQDYCDDLANNKTPQTGQVLKFFNTYSVQELQAKKLWERLETKVQSFGGCNGGNLPKPL